MSLAVERKVPVKLPVVAVLLEELGTLYGAFEPFGAFLHLVVECGEHPHLAALQPHELVGVEDAAVAVEAGEVAAELLVLRLVEPEGYHFVEQFGAILRGELFEINHSQYGF